MLEATNRTYTFAALLQLLREPPPEVKVPQVGRRLGLGLSLRERVWLWGRARGQGWLAGGVWECWARNRWQSRPQESMVGCRVGTRCCV